MVSTSWYIETINQLIEVSVCWFMVSSIRSLLVGIWELAPAAGQLC